MSLVYTFRFFAKWYARFVEARTRGLLIFFGGKKKKENKENGASLWKHRVIGAIIFGESLIS